MTAQEIFKEYQRGVELKSQLDLFNTTDVAERFYAGAQWYGVNAEGLPTPVFNFIKRGVDWKVAQVKDKSLTIRFSADGVGDTALNPAEGDASAMADLLSDWSRCLWESLKMDFLGLEALKDAAVTGDCLQYFYWDTAKGSGSFAGDISTQLISAVDYYPADFNQADVQRQPSLIIAIREDEETVKREAGRHAEMVRADFSTEYAAGDLAKYESGGKVTVLLRMYKKDGFVHFTKSTKDVIIKTVKTRLTLYPLAKMSWYSRKNSAFGAGEVAQLIPNQVFANKAMALNMMHLIQSASPRVIYDATRIKKWSAALSAAVPVSGDVSNVASYMQPPSLGYDIYRMFETAKSASLEMMGANEAVLGDVNPDNTSAFLAVRETALTPIKSIAERYFNFVEDTARIWLDFFLNYYAPERPVAIRTAEGIKFVTLPELAFRASDFYLRIDVSSAAVWSEVSAVNNLGRLFEAGVITAAELVERLPEGHIKDRAGILKRLKAQEMSAAMNGEAMNGQ